MRFRTPLLALAGLSLALAGTVSTVADAADPVQRQVETETTLTGTTPSAGVVVVRVAVTSPDGTPAGSFNLWELDQEQDSATDLGTKEAVNGKATFSLSKQTPGIHKYQVLFTPDNFSAYDQSSAIRNLRATTTAKITEAIPAQSTPNRPGAGTVTIDLAGVAEAPTGTVVVRDGDRTLDRGTLNRLGKVAIELPLLKDGRYRLTIVWAGDARGERTTKDFAFVQR